MTAHCYMHSQYQDTCRMCRLAYRNTLRQDDITSETVYNTAREDDDTSSSISFTSVVLDTIVDAGTNDTSIKDDSSGIDSGSDFGGFDGGSSGGSGADF